MDLDLAEENFIATHLRELRESENMAATFKFLKKQISTYVHIYTNHALKITK